MQHMCQDGTSMHMPMHIYGNAYVGYGGGMGMEFYNALQLKNISQKFGRSRPNSDRRLFPHSRSSSIPRSIDAQVCLSSSFCRVERDVYVHIDRLNAYTSPTARQGP